MMDYQQEVKNTVDEILTILKGEVIFPDILPFTKPAILIPGNVARVSMYGMVNAPHNLAVVTTAIDSNTFSLQFELDGYRPNRKLTFKVLSDA